MVARSVHAVQEARKAVAAPLEEQPAPVKEISAERRRQIEYEYEEMGRLVRHVQEKNRSPES